MRSKGIHKLLVAALAGGLVTSVGDIASAQVQKRDHRANPRTATTPKAGATAALKMQSISTQSGPIGAKVTLRGVFPAGTRLLLDGKEVATTAKLSRVLTFKVPPRQVGAQALVLDLGGQRVDAGTFTIEGPPGTVAPIPRDHRRGDRDHRGEAGGADPGATDSASIADHRGDRRAELRSRGRALVTDFAPRGGEVGTEVTIRGRRLDNNAQVVLGGQVVPLVGAATANTLRFVIPPGTAAGQATVAIRQGRSKDAVIGSFTVTPKANQWKDERKARREAWRKEAQKAWKARQKQLAADQAAREEALRQREAALAAKRIERRAERRAALKAKWEAAFLGHQEVRAELALHAERTARLERMLRLAEAGAHGDLVIRINVLIKSEGFRHDRRMNDLRGVHLKGG